VPPQGGQLVWIAPSGGRDRPTGDGEWLPAPFDGTAAELMRTMLTKAAPDGHLYPCSMSSWGIMPPPQVRHLPVTCFLLPCMLSSSKVAPEWAPVPLLHAVVGHLAVAAGPQHSDPGVFSKADSSDLACCSRRARQEDLAMSMLHAHQRPVVYATFPALLARARSARLCAHPHRLTDSGCSTLTSMNANQPE